MLSKPVLADNPLSALIGDDEVEENSSKGSSRIVSLLPSRGVSPGKGLFSPLSLLSPMFPGIDEEHFSRESCKDNPTTMGRSHRQSVGSSTSSLRRRSIGGVLAFRSDTPASCLTNFPDTLGSVVDRVKNAVAAELASFYDDEEATLLLGREQYREMLEEVSVIPSVPCKPKPSPSTGSRATPMVRGNTARVRRFESVMAHREETIVKVRRDICRGDYVQYRKHYQVKLQKKTRQLVLESIVVLFATIQMLGKKFTDSRRKADALRLIGRWIIPRRQLIKHKERRQAQIQSLCLTEDHKPAISVLAQDKLLSLFPKETLQRIWEGLRPVFYEKGEFLLFQGAEGRDAFVLGEGVVDVLIHQTKKAFRVENGANCVAQVKVSAVIGALGMISGQPRLATIRAASDVVVWKMIRDDLFPPKKTFVQEDQARIKQALQEIAKLHQANLPKVYQGSFTAKHFGEFGMFENIDVYVLEQIRNFKGIQFEYLQPGEIVLAGNTQPRAVAVCLRGSLQVTWPKNTRTGFPVCPFDVDALGREPTLRNHFHRVIDVPSQKTLPRAEVMKQIFSSSVGGGNGGAVVVPARCVVGLGCLFSFERSVLEVSVKTPADILWIPPEFLTSVLGIYNPSARVKMKENFNTLTAEGLTPLTSQEILSICLLNVPELAKKERQFQSWALFHHLQSSLQLYPVAFDAETTLRSTPSKREVYLFLTGRLKEDCDEQKFRNQYSTLATAALQKPVGKGSSLSPAPPTPRSGTAAGKRTPSALLWPNLLWIYEGSDYVEHATTATKVTGFRTDASEIARLFRTVFIPERLSLFEQLLRH